MAVSDLTTQIPGEVWGALVGAFIALGGVMLTNRTNREQWITSLRHDAQQRDREREMALKREIYIPAAEGVNGLLRLIYSMNDLSLTNEQLSLEFKEGSTAVAKLHVVGSNELLKAANAFMHEFSVAYMTLLLRRAPLVDNKRKMEIIDGVMRNVDQDQNRLIEYMRQANLSGHPEQTTMNMLDQNFRYGQTRRQELTDQLKAAWTEQNKGSLALSGACFSEGIKLGGLIPPLLFAARRELEIPIDEAAFMEQFTLYQEKGQQAFQTFLGDVAKLSANSGN